MCGIMKQKTKVEILICLGVILILSKLIYEMISETYFTYFINNFICYILSFLMSVTIVTMYYLTFCKYQKNIYNFNNCLFPSCWYNAFLPSTL